MIITTLELPPDHIPMINPTLQEAAEVFGGSLDKALTKAVEKQPEMGKILGRYMTGRHVVFMTLHTEPAVDLLDGD